MITYPQNKEKGTTTVNRQTFVILDGITDVTGAQAV